MASQESQICLNNNKFSTNSNSDEIWTTLSLTHVEYPKGDLLGKCFALASLLPFSIVSGFIALMLFRRDLHTVTFFAGVMLNDMSCYVLKYFFREARPMSRSIIYTEYGMPSAHSQFMWFFTTYVMLFIFIRLQHNYSKASLETLWRAIITVCTVSAACIVSYARVYLLYHSWNQVFWGLLFGSFNACVWFSFTYFVLTPFFPIVASWRISEFLLLRDTTLIPNVLWFEYTNSRQETRARARKLVSTKSQ